MNFWDSSALIPLLAAESYSKFLSSLYDQTEEITVWWGSKVECYSAIYRKHRAADIDDFALISVKKNFAELSRMWIEVLPDESIRNEATVLLSEYTLRAADALQLAAAIVWSHYSPKGHYFVCLDARLREAAAKEGLKIVPEKL